MSTWIKYLFLFLYILVPCIGLSLGSVMLVRQKHCLMATVNSLLVCDQSSQLCQFSLNYSLNNQVYTYLTPCISCELLQSSNIPTCFYNIHHPDSDNDSDTFGSTTLAIVILSCSACWIVILPISYFAYKILQHQSRDAHIATNSPPHVTPCLLPMVTINVQDACIAIGRSDTDNIVVVEQPSL